MPRKVKVTIDHDEIRRWVDARGGWPAMVQRAGSPGEIRIGFPESTRDEKAKQISWGEFLRKLDEACLALEFEERDEDGGLSEFHRLISRQEAADALKPELRRPSTAKRRLERLPVREGEPTAERLSEEKEHRRKKNVPTIASGGKEKKKKIRKAA